MLIYEYKVDATKAQAKAIDEAIQICQFIRNKCLRLWMDDRHINRNDLQCYCAVLAKQYPFASCLNSQARQASADRAWDAVSRFYKNCKQGKPGKKGYPQFQHDNRSVEYKTTGWKLDADGKHITFTDGCGIGRLRLIGKHTQRLEEYPLKHIKRVRIIKRADGYYVQFAVDAQRNVAHVPTGKHVGIDMGLKAFLTDSEGHTVANPHHHRRAEKRLKLLHRRLSRTQKKSRNRQKARHRLAKAFLKVQRQREDFARKTANALITSNDLIAYEDLQIANMVKNSKLAKSISDASWGRFLRWLIYYGQIHQIAVIAVAPAFTSQECSACGTRIKKSLSVRTHRCSGCGLVLDRDHNAAINILHKALGRTGGQSGTGGFPVSQTGLPQNAWGKATSTGVSVMAPPQAASWNQEPPALEPGECQIMSSQIT